MNRQTRSLVSISTAVAVLMVLSSPPSAAAAPVLVGPVRSRRPGGTPDEAGGIGGVGLTAPDRLAPARGSIHVVASTTFGGLQGPATVSSDRRAVHQIIDEALTAEAPRRDGLEPLRTDGRHPAADGIEPILWNGPHDCSPTGAWTFTHGSHHHIEEALAT